MNRRCRLVLLAAGHHGAGCPGGLRLGAGGVWAAGAGEVGGWGSGGPVRAVGEYGQRAHRGQVRGVGAGGAGESGEPT